MLKWTREIFSDLVLFGISASKLTGTGGSFLRRNEPGESVKGRKSTRLERGDEHGLVDLKAAKGKLRRRGQMVRVIVTLSPKGWN